MDVKGVGLRNETKVRIRFSLNLTRGGVKWRVSGEIGRQKRGRLNREMQSGAPAHCLEFEGHPHAEACP